MERCAKEATKLIVAQRIGTIRHADNIIVLADGKMLVMMLVTNVVLALSAISASVIGFALMILIAKTSQRYFLT